jgi:hypothetical protein
VNIGYVALALKTAQAVNTLRESIELVSDKFGVVLLVLGVMHFFNLFVFSRMRKSPHERVISRFAVPNPPQQA